MSMRMGSRENLGTILAVNTAKTQKTSFVKFQKRTKYPVTCLTDFLLSEAPIVVISVTVHHIFRSVIMVQGF